MYCPSCGTQVAENLKFCNNCGKPLFIESNPSDAKLEEISPNDIINSETPSKIAERHAGSKRPKGIGMSVLLFGIILYILYYLFLRHDPTTDGKKISIAACKCTTEYTENRINIYLSFIEKFDNHKFEKRREAQSNLDAQLNPHFELFQKCQSKAQSDFIKLKEIYVTNKDQVEKFEYAAKAQLGLCQNSKQEILEDLESQLQLKLMGLADLEGDINTILAEKYGTKYRVTTDNDRKWEKYAFENFVTPERKKFEYYPYIVKGDFNGDGNLDLAAEVINTENNYGRLAIIWGKSNAIKFYDGQLCSAISFIPNNEWKSHWESGSVQLQGDAILVTCFEKSAWILYWDGNSFQQYWMSD
ncbi:MAG: zinc-ribbon domain-containing protein [Saprospiraceae bacterium]